VGLNEKGGTWYTGSVPASGGDTILREMNKDRKVGLLIHGISIFIYFF
jgi:hypothetical protein